jgi:hypothetical protein
MKMLVCGSAALLLSACSMTAPVEGRVQQSSEIFKGQVTGYLDHTGVLSLLLNTGVACTGKYVFISSRDGEGVFDCADGRSGAFHFASTGSRGIGAGKIDDKTFTFAFGY